MTGCPDLDRLNRLLAGGLPGETLQEMTQHVEECAVCQAVLDAQSHDSAPSVKPIPGRAEALGDDRLQRLTAAVLGTVDDPDSAWDDPGLPQIDGYEIQGVLGRGGMGIVLKARHVRMQRDVAIKILSADALREDSAVDRFFREARAAAALSHPHIVAAFDAGEQDGVHYLVMEYVDGWNLGDVVRRVGPLNPQEAVESILQAARGLQAAHEQGIIHRDIKPANLLLDRRGVVRILDMGLATINDNVLNRQDTSEQNPLTESGQIVGTVDYMAPEQALDTRSVDHRCDIYSLGCTLFRLLTGRRLYDGDTLMKRILAHRDQPVPSPGQFRTDIPPELDDAFRRMVAKQPRERLQSMTEVIDVLERIPQTQHREATRGLMSLVQRMDEAAEGRSSVATAAMADTDTYQDTVPGSVHSISPQRQRQHKRTTWAGFAIVTTILIAAAVIIYLRLGRYDVQITLADAQIRLRIDDQVIVLDDDGKPVRLTAGPHALVLERDGLKTETDEFTVARDGNNVFHVAVIRGRLTVVEGGPSMNPAGSAVSGARGTGNEGIDKASASPSRTAPLSEPDWQNLLTVIDPVKDAPADDQFVNEGTLDNGELVLGHRSRLTIPVPVTGSYRLQADFTTWSGPKFLHLECPVADRLPVLVLSQSDNEDGFLGAGLHKVDGRFATDPRNPTFLKKLLLRSGERQTLDVNVVVSGAGVHIQANVDDQTLVDWSGQLSQLPAGENPATARLRLMTWKGMLRLHTLRFRAIVAP